MGTPLYMSPEQWVCSRDVGPGSDIWSLGVILFELLAGQPPFAHAQLAKLCAMVLNSAPPSLADLRLDVPPQLVQVIEQCLEKLVVRRYANMAELAVALAPFGDEGAQRSCERIIDLLDASGPVTRSSRLEVNPPAQSLSSAPPTSHSWQHALRSPSRPNRGRVIALVATTAVLLAVGAAGLGGVLGTTDTPVSPASNRAAAADEAHTDRGATQAASPPKGAPSPAASTSSSEAKPPPRSTANAGGGPTTTAVADGSASPSSATRHPPRWGAPVKPTTTPRSSGSKPPTRPKPATGPKPSARTCGEDGFDRCR